jgi:tetratricopeptide (TPR) repeat protein
MERREDLTSAIGRYESYVRADPGNPLLWLNLGDLYHKASRLDEAIACFERCLHDHPEYSNARSHLASVRLTQHRFQDAERLLRGLLRESEPDDPSLWFNLGLSLYYQQRWPEAEECFTKAQARGLATPDCYAYLARCRHYAGDMARALELCQQWVDTARDAESRGYLALLQMDHGDMAEAATLAEDVLRGSPDNTNAGLVVGTASMEAQEIARASEQFERILTREPDNARAWLGVGLARLYQQQHTESVAALQKAVELLPDSVGIRVTLGWATVTTRDMVRAEQIFRDALDIDHNFAEAHGGLAVALAFQTRVDAAKEAIKRARGLDPHGFGAVFAQTILLKVQGKDKMATDILAGLLQQAPRPDSKTLIEQIEIFTRKNPPAPGKLPGGGTRTGGAVR